MPGLGDPPSVPLAVDGGAFSASVIFPRVLPSCFMGLEAENQGHFAEVLRAWTILMTTGSLMPGKFPEKAKLQSVD